MESDEAELKREYDAAVVAMRDLVIAIQEEGVITVAMYPRLIETRLRWWMARERYKGDGAGTGGRPPDGGERSVDDTRG